MTNSNTCDEKTLESITEKLPPGWQCTTYRTTNNYKRIAVFEHQDTSQRVTIRPWKTYNQPGFPNTHRVLALCEDQREVLAVEQTVNRIPDAETVALTAMQQRTETDQ